MYDQNSQSTDIASGAGSLSKLVSQLKSIFAPLSAVPFFFAGGQRPQNGQRAGSGVYLLPGAIAAGVATPLAHPLGRVPVCVKLVDNGALPQQDPTVTARSNTSVTIVPPVALDATAILYLG